MSSHAFTGPGEVEPTAFQRALVSIAAYFDARYRKAHGRSPRVHERDTMTLVHIVHSESGGHLGASRMLVDEVFGHEQIQGGDTLHDCWVRRAWWIENGRPSLLREMPPKWRDLLEKEIHDKATLALKIEREREERVRRGA